MRINVRFISDEISFEFLNVFCFCINWVFGNIFWFVWTVTALLAFAGLNILYLRSMRAQWNSFALMKRETAAKAAENGCRFLSCGNYSNAPWLTPVSQHQRSAVSQSELVLVSRSSRAQDDNERERRQVIWQRLLGASSLSESLLVLKDSVSVLLSTSLQNFSCQLNCDLRALLLVPCVQRTTILNELLVQCPRLSLDLCFYRNSLLTIVVPLFFIS